MTNFYTRWMIAALAVTAAAVTASAQTYKAEIPLAFRAGANEMAAGSYKVTMIHVLSGAPMIRLDNEATNKRALVMTASGDSAKTLNPGSAVLQFECFGADCTLRQISWDDLAVRIPVTRHAPPVASIRIVNVSMNAR